MVGRRTNVVERFFFYFKNTIHQVNKCSQLNILNDLNIERFISISNYSTNSAAVVVLFIFVCLFFEQCSKISMTTHKETVWLWEGLWVEQDCSREQGGARGRSIKAAEEPEMEAAGWSRPVRSVASQCQRAVSCQSHSSESYLKSCMISLRASLFLMILNKERTRHLYSTTTNLTIAATLFFFSFFNRKIELQSQQNIVSYVTSGQFGVSVQADITWASECVNRELKQ